MKVVCAWCRTEGRPDFVADREPLDDPHETHGICPMHARRMLEGLPARSFPGIRLLVVVRRSEASLHQHLEHSFATVNGVAVILERRQSERRSVASPFSPERRRGERRLRLGVVSPLGYRLVRFGTGRWGGRPAPAPENLGPDRGL